MKKWTFLLLLASNGVAASDQFSSTIQIDGGSSQYQRYDSLIDLADQFKGADLNQLFPQYSEVSALDASVQLLGVGDINLRYAANSNRLIFSVPSAGIYQEFDGASRSDSQRMLSDYFKNLPENFTHALVASSPHHPVNRAREQSIQIIGDNSVLATDMANDLRGNLESNNLASYLSFTPRFGHYTQDGIDTSVIHLPLAYAKQITKAGSMLVIDLPVTLSQSDEAIAGQGSVGLGINFALTEDWFLMPSVRSGATVSADYGVSASLFSGSLASNYRYSHDEKISFHVVNIVSYYQTGSLEIQDFQGNYELENFVYRNGIDITHRLNTRILDRAVTLKAYLSRTDYTGDALYSNYSHDFGFSFGFKSPYLTKWVDELRFGINATLGDNDYKGVSFSTGYRF